MLQILHNPRCTKSRGTLALLEERGLKPEVIHYLDTPPSRAELQTLLRKLGYSPRQLIRRGETIYAELGLDDTSLSDDSLIDAMLAHPILIERPIVVVGDQARIGRPPEAVLDILPG